MIDTTTASGRLMFGIFAALAEFERELIVERTRAGIAAAQASGQALRPPTRADPKEDPPAPEGHAQARESRPRFRRRVRYLEGDRAYRYVGPDGELRALAKRALLELQGAGQGETFETA